MNYRKEGAAAYDAGKHVDTNPYVPGSYAHKQWNYGWHEAWYEKFHPKFDKYH